MGNLRSRRTLATTLPLVLPFDAQGAIISPKAPSGAAITRIDLETEAEVPGIDEESFREQAETAKANCPVRKALAGVEIGLEARLV